LGYAASKSTHPPPLTEAWVVALVQKKKTGESRAYKMLLLNVALRTDGGTRTHSVRPPLCQLSVRLLNHERQVPNGSLPNAL